VRWADSQPEISHGVAYLGPFIKARPTDHAIRQANRQEAILESPHLMTGPHQYRNPVKVNRTHYGPVPTLKRLYLFPDPARLGLAVPMADQAHFLALFRIGPQRLAKPPAIRFDQSRGSTKDLWGRTVV